MLTLISFLKKVNDPRKNSGKRHPLWLILLLVILGLMFGYLGYKLLHISTVIQALPLFLIWRTHLIINCPSFTAI